jgi:excisionase family DNA binding protein
MEEFECCTYTVREAAHVLGLSHNATFAAIYHGEIPALRFGRRVVVPKEALHQLLENPSMVRHLATPPPRRWVRPT